MDKTIVAVTEPVVESETTQAESPQAEAQPTEEQTIQKQETAVTVSEEASDVESVEEPKDPKDFQVQRLADDNRRLKEEKRAREKSESAFSAFRPQVPQVGQSGTVRVEDYIDPLTGETNYPAYQNAVTQYASYQAQKTVEDIVDENNARNKYPELFADSEVEQEIADRWFAAKMRGEEPSISDIAGRVNTRYQKAVSKAEKIGAEKILTEVTPKEQASLAATGQTSEAARQASSSEELEDLRVASRKGNSDAITARMKGIPWANK